eukprot:3483592-Amphidinium_carterae.1
MGCQWQISGMTTWDGMQLIAIFWNDGCHSCKNYGMTTLVEWSTQTVMTYKIDPQKLTPKGWPIVHGVNPSPYSGPDSGVNHWVHQSTHD